VWIVQFDQIRVIFANLDVCDIQLVSHIVKSVDLIIPGTKEPLFKLIGNHLLADSFIHLFDIIIFSNSLNCLYKCVFDSVLLYRIL
jgi:hypothetical protein